MWRDTSRDVTILGLDAWALPPLFLIPFSGWSMWAIYLAGGIALFFGILRAIGLPVAGAYRMLLALAAGEERPATPAWKQRYFA